MAWARQSNTLFVTFLTVHLLTVVVMGDTNQQMNIPIQVRGHELTQLGNFIDTVTEDDFDEADQLAEILDTHIMDAAMNSRENEQFYTYVSMPADDWHTVNRGLTRHRKYNDGQRSWWLQKKLVGRLNERLSDIDN